MLNSGTRLAGRYEIVSHVGAGGMGEVYRARDLRLDREVAVKVLPDHLARHPDALSRFEREAKALAALSHPNILAIYDFGAEEGVAFAVMELLKGETLRKQITGGRLAWSKAVEIGIAIGEGLTAAHSQKVIHRDLKPENIFLTSDGVVKILDFGLARRETVPDDVAEATTQDPLTEAGTLLGTVPYMSPEQVRGLPVDARTDIFSLGCMLYEMVAGTPAFWRRTQADTISAILNETLPALSHSEKTIPAELDGVISHALEKDREKRFQSARDLTFGLKTLLNASKITTTKFPKSKSRLFVWVALLLTLLSVGVILYLMPARGGKAMHSIAILPFSNGSKDPDAEYLSDGITESIINSLSRLPELRVMARSTVFTYKGKVVDPGKVGKDLKVEAIVTGEMTLQGDTLVIQAELVSVSDGVQLWGDQFHRKMKDVLDLQDEISQEIVRSLSLKLTGTETKNLSKHYTQNAEAYQLYLKGLYYHHKESPEDYQKAMESYQAAIAKDSNYALAYAGLNWLYSSMGFEGLISPKEAAQKSKAAIRKALEIDNTLPEVHLALAADAWAYGWNWSEFEAEVQKGLAIDPNNVEIRYLYSQNLRALGRFDEAIVQGKKTQELDPLSIDKNKSLGVTYFWAHQYDRAIEQFRKLLDLDPNSPEVHDHLADVYARKGNYAKAIEEEQTYLKLSQDEEGANALAHDYQTSGYQQAKRLQFQRALANIEEAAKEQYVSPIYFAIVYSSLNEKDQAFEWLEKAFQERAPWLTYIKYDPQFDNLHSDPRFTELLGKIGLPL